MTKQILFFIFSLFVTSIVFSINNEPINPKVTTKGDCVLFKEVNSNSIYDVCDKISFSVLDKSDCKKAFDNLKSFCAQTKGYKGPDSSYIFDHLLDIGFRKLDNINYYGGKPDPVGKEWRNKVNERKENIDGIYPSNVLNDFYEYRNRKNGKLYTRYLKVCDDIVKILNRLYTISPVFSVDSTFSRPLDGLYKMCLYMAQERAYKEKEFITLLLIRKSNFLIERQWEIYVLDEFIKKDWPRLLEKMSKWVGYFTRVVKLMGDGTKICNPGF